MIEYNGIVTAKKLNVRKRASKGSDIVRVLDKDTVVTITNMRNGFGKIEDGWVMLDFIEPLRIDAGVEEPQEVVENEMVEDVE